METAHAESWRCIQVKISGIVKVKFLISLKTLNTKNQSPSSVPVKKYSWKFHKIYRKTFSEHSALCLYYYQLVSLSMEIV